MFGRYVDSHCNCCIDPENETINHVFSERKAASYSWNLIDATLGVKHRPYPIYIFDTLGGK